MIAVINRPSRALLRRGNKLEARCRARNATFGLGRRTREARPHTPNLPRMLGATMGVLTTFAFAFAVPPLAAADAAGSSSRAISVGVARTGDDQAVFRTITTRIPYYNASLARLGSVPRRPQQSRRAASIGKRWAALYRAAGTDSRRLGVLRPSAVDAIQAKACGLRALRRLRSGSKSGTRAYRALSQGRLAAYRRLGRKTSVARRGLEDLRACPRRPKGAPAPKPPPSPIPAPPPGPGGGKPPPQPAQNPLVIEEFFTVNTLIRKEISSRVPAGGTIVDCADSDGLVVQYRSRPTVTLSATWELPGDIIAGPFPTTPALDGLGLTSVGVPGIQLPNGWYTVHLEGGELSATASVALMCPVP
jgi:hypothetical protein